MTNPNHPTRADIPEDREASTPYIDPTFDAINRFERQIDRQIGVMESVARRSEYVAGLITILISGIAILMRNSSDFISVAPTQAPIPSIPASFAIAIITLILSAVGASATYTSADPVIGPHSDTAKTIADELFKSSLNQQYPPNIYKSKLLSDYSKTIKANKKRYKKSTSSYYLTLYALMTGLVYLGLAILYTTLELPSTTNFRIFIAVTSILTISFIFILYKSITIYMSARKISVIEK